jgi:hypothetical protein
VRRLFEIAIGIGLSWAAGQAAGQVLPAPPPSPEPAGATEKAEPQPTSAAAAPPAMAEPAPPPIGPAYDDDAAMPAHAVEVASYTLHASLDPSAHTLHGEGQIRWRNTSRVPQNELYIHLYLNAFKNQRTYFMRLPTGGFRGSGKLNAFGYIDVKRFAVREMEGKDVWADADRTSPGDPEDETDIRIPLPRAVPPDATITIDVAWDEHLPALLFRTGYVDSFHMVGQWFPKLARLSPDGRWAHFPFHHFSEFYADYGTYDVTVETPDNFIVGATGHLEGEVRKGGRIERRYLAQDIHDFSFTAWDAFKEINEKTEDGVAIRCLYPKGFDRVAAVEIETVRFGLDYFGKLFGRYPYGTLTIVHPPPGADEAGGMEYPTLITTGDSWFLPLTGVRIPDIVTIHELGHQWFYGLVGTNENAFPFLDEGINSYIQDDALEARFPGSSVVRSLGLSIGLPATSRVAAVDRFRNAPVAQPASAFLSGADYGALVYSRTATILSTLARVHGADQVRRALGRYARRYRFEHPGPEEFIAAIHEVLGSDAAEALRAALFDRATVDYIVDGIESKKDTAPEGIFGDPAHPSPAPVPEGAASYRGSALVRRLGTLRFPVDIDFIGADGSVQRVRWDARESAARLPYTGKSGLSAVVIDPEHKILLDENLTNNARRVERPLVFLRVLERALFGAEAALAVMLP